MRSLLPGPLTLIFPNPEQRFPLLPGRAGHDRRARAGAPRRSAADRHAGRRGRRDEREPPRRPGSAAARRGARGDSRAEAVLVDGGELPGTPSTVVDLTGPEPRILREGAVPAAEVLERRAGLMRTMPEMAVAHETLEQLRTAGLAEIDPEIAELLGKELERQRGQIELIASENFTWPSVLRGRRLGADEQVRRGLSGQALLRRLRGRRRDRADRDRPREGALRSRARERPAARGRPDEHGRLHGRARSRATRSSRSSSRTAAI